jgi:hypothetical protein
MGISPIAKRAPATMIAKQYSGPNSYSMAELSSFGAANASLSSWKPKPKV